MAVREFKPVKPRVFLMLLFSQARLLEKNRFTVLCSSSLDIIPDYRNFSADGSWNQKVLCKF